MVADPRQRSPLAVVTGAAGGLGAAVAAHLGAAGFGIAAVDIDESALARTVAALGDDGIRAHPFIADIAAGGGVADLCSRIHAQLGAVSHLMNVAGILHRGGLGDTDEQAWRRTFDVNVSGPYLLTQALADDLREAPYGRVVNCTSISASVGYPFTAYAASKAALSNLTSSLLFAFWGSHVTVNAVAPGAMRTPMLDATLEAKMTAKTPTGEIVSADEVAAVMAFLASREASGVNGVTVTVDGGATAVFSYA
jgi:2-hydroxycyclohexanecarboxyl-CoA dehydrogenase